MLCGRHLSQMQPLDLGEEVRLKARYSGGQPAPWHCYYVIASTQRDLAPTNSALSWLVMDFSIPVSLWNLVKSQMECHEEFSRISDTSVNQVNKDGKAAQICRHAYICNVWNLKPSTGVPKLIALHRHVDLLILQSMWVPPGLSMA